MPTIAEQISKNSTTPSSNIAEALVGYGGGSGSGGGVFVINTVASESESGPESHLSKTAEEIAEAINKGLLPVLINKWIDNPMGAEKTNVFYLYNAQVPLVSGSYYFNFVAISGIGTLRLSGFEYTAANGSDYPLLLLDNPVV